MKQIVQGLWEIDEIGDAVHCYLWEWAGGLTLIDSGYARDADVILQALVARHYPVHNIQRIIVTHTDADHTGGLRRLREATQAKVVCHAVEKELLEQPFRRWLPSKRGSLWLRVPMTVATLARPGQRLPSTTPDDLVVDGQRLPEGFIVIHTPGRSPGHISLLHPERRLLIAGDALSNRAGKLRAPNGLTAWDAETAHKSIWKLAKKYGDDFEAIAFGHGPPILTNGGKRVKGLASRIFSTAV
jgi:glyoxylase-like metal-dependent hydrolase (beta-lactamase superfamily II)